MAGSGETYRLEGNDAFAKGEWYSAIRSYSRALVIVQDDKRVYSNRSAARVRLAESLSPGGEHREILRSAIEDADKVIELDPNWSKGYYRKARALELLEKEKDRLAGASTQENPTNSGGVGTGGDVPSKTVLMLGSLGHFSFLDDPVLKAHKSHLLAKGFRVEAMRFKASAVVEKLRSGQIGACVVSQVIHNSPKDLFKDYQWLETLSAWVRQGGVFVVAQGESEKLCEYIFKGCFDLPWVFRGYSYRSIGSTIQRTDTDLPTDYRVKACSLSRVAPSDRLYAETPVADDDDDSDDDSDDEYGSRLQRDEDYGNMAPVAVTEVEQGIVAFLGDTGWGEKTREIMRHLVSLRIDAADGPQLDATHYDVLCESSDDNRDYSDDGNDDDADESSDNNGEFDWPTIVRMSKPEMFNEDGGYGQHMSSDDVQLLLEQGVKPWDEDADAFLDALKSHDFWD